jgi:hypothetical protein
VSVVGIGDAVELVQSVEAVFDEDLAEYYSRAWLFDG